MVVADRGRRGERIVDLLVGDRLEVRHTVLVGLLLGIADPGPGVAVGLELESHAVRIRAGGLEIEAVHAAR